jgi:NAD(P)-dependent dehydrogenase (short-subunit alcohol dehydrogenase family)
VKEESAPSRAIPDLFSCAGNVALVTGGGTGIGLACAEALGTAGAFVVVAGMGADRALSALQDKGVKVVTIECDVTRTSDLIEVVDRIRRDFGRLDTVVANAGAALDELGGDDALDRMDRMYALHVRSVAELAQLTLPLVADGGGGSFIVMSSIAGLRGNQVLSGYGVTKAANAEIARNLAVQWGGRAVRANAISPGVIDTEFARPITDDQRASAIRLAKTPLGRFGRPHEVAAAVVWLASKAGGFVTGQNIVIDGGTLISD